jgi:hypothetical protein
MASMASNFEDLKTFLLGAHQQLAISTEIDPIWRQSQG